MGVFMQLTCIVIAGLNDDHSVGSMSSSHSDLSNHSGTSIESEAYFHSRDTYMRLRERQKDDVTTMKVCMNIHIVSIYECMYVCNGSIYLHTVCICEDFCTLVYMYIYCMYVCICVYVSMSVYLHLYF